MGVRDEGLLYSELLDQLAQSFPLDWPQIQELHAEDLSSDPPNDRMVNVHPPVIVWGKDPQVEAHVGSDGGLGLGCTACAGQIEECPSASTSSVLEKNRRQSSGMRGEVRNSFLSV